jgi:hypothetical protein
MTYAEYTHHMDMLMNATRAFCMLSCDIPLDELLKAVRTCETLGPVLDPTKYINGGRRNLETAGELIEAAIRFRKSVEATCKAGASHA